MRLALALPLVVLLAGPVTSQIVFQTPATIEAGNLTTTSLLGDLNEDGHPDLITNHFFFGGGPRLSLGLAGGQFGASQPLAAAGQGPVSSLGDFNEDGHLDLVTLLDQQFVTSVSVLLGHGDGSFEPPIGINGDFEGPDATDVGDFDADGHLDVAIYNGAFGFWPGSIVAVFGHGDGTFGAAIDLEADVPFGSSGVIRVGDANGDGLDDIVFTTSVSSPTMLSLGDGRFTQVSCASGCGMMADKDCVMADVNGDGREDLVTTVRVMAAQPDGSFAFTGQMFPLDGVPWTVALADLDDDGVLDAIVARNGSTTEFDPNLTTGDVRIMRGNGNGTFQAPGVIVSHVPQPRSLNVADVDGDGRPDIVVSEMQFSPATGRVLLNRTYGPGSPFLDLGGALGGSNGYPIQLASGTLVTGQPFAFALQSGPPSGAAWHIVGLSALNAPFKGGTMIPALNLMNGPFPLNASGNLTLAGNWPSGGSGLTLWVQFWMPSGGGPAGLVSSSGVRAQIP